MEQYAEIKDSVVTNLISLRREQEAEFPDCVEVGELFVEIGDTYTDGLFYRKGKQIKTNLQRMGEQLITVSKAALVSAKETCKNTDVAPKANVGLFIAGAEPWEADKTYERYDLFQYNGAIGWVKQAHTSQEHYPPFSIGVEALYGARPVPDEDGVYPYRYNMAVEVGMKVREYNMAAEIGMSEHEGSTVYECIQATDDLLYAPSQVPALFKVVE